MVELERYPNQVEEEQVGTILSSLPFGGPFLGRRYNHSADIRGSGPSKDVGLLLLGILVLLFTGVIGSKAITEKRQNDSLRSELKLRLLEVTR